MAYPTDETSLLLLGHVHLGPQEQWDKGCWLSSAVSCADSWPTLALVNARWETKQVMASLVKSVTGKPELSELGHPGRPQSRRAPEVQGQKAGRPCWHRFSHPLSPPSRFWRQVGGHLRVVEASAQGVVWGIGYDGTAWVHTGGYGGGHVQGKAPPAEAAGLAPPPATASLAFPCSDPSGFPASRQSHCCSVDTGWQLADR